MSADASGAPREAQSIFNIKLVGDERELDLARNRKVVSGSRLSVLANIDPNPNNVSAPGGVCVSAAIYL